MITIPSPAGDSDERRLGFAAEALSRRRPGEPFALLLSDGRGPFSRFHAAAFGPRQRFRLFPEGSRARLRRDVWTEGGWHPAAEFLVDDPLAELERWVGGLDRAPGLPRLGGGALGVLHYEVARWIHPDVWSRPLASLPAPVDWMAFAGGIVEDRWEGRRWRWGGLPDRSTDPTNLWRLPARLERTRLLPLPIDYRQAVDRARARIAAGEFYQLNLARAWEARAVGDPVTLWLRWYAANPAGCFAYLDFGERQILSTSPELFLERSGRRLLTRPIKGTRPRGATPEEDLRRLAQLESSDKERAELTMIVDLMRSDLGRVAARGTVRTVSLGQTESYSNVHHRVATVSCELGAETGLSEILRATFPAGSIAGCPKLRAMQWIDRLENGRPRGAFAGSLGWLGACGDFSLNVAIRTVEISDGRAVFQVGSGIVADSDPEAEEEETEHKAATFLRPIEGTWYWIDGDFLLGNPEDPPGATGLFETLLAEDGRLRHAPAHRRRMERSAAALSIPHPDWDWVSEAERLVALNVPKGPARVRVTLWRQEAQHSRMRITALPFERPTAPWRLYPVPLPLDEEARHKKLERRHPPQALARAQAAGSDEAVLLDAEGWVCEGSRTNLFWWAEGALCRPDPSLPQLPGVAAERVLEAARREGIAVRALRVAWPTVMAAEHLWVTNALIGLWPASASGGRIRDEPPEILRLRRRLEGDGE